MKLNGWQRIGVVFSVLWVLGLTYYLRHQDTQRLYAANNQSLESCQSQEDNDENFNAGDCLREKLTENRDLWLARSWEDAIAGAVISLFGIWMLVIIGLKTVKWTKAGFNK